MGLSHAIGRLLRAAQTPGSATVGQHPRDGWWTVDAAASRNGGAPEALVEPGAAGGHEANGDDASAVQGSGSVEPLVTEHGPMLELEAAAGVVEALRLGYHLGAAIERIVMAQTQGSGGEPKLREAIWLIERHIELISTRDDAARLAAILERLDRNGEVIAGLQVLSAAVDAQRGSPLGGQPAGRAAASENPRALTIAQAAARPAPEPEPAPIPVPVSPTRDEPEDLYPLGREIALMVVRWGLVLIVLVIVILVATLAAGWR
jgi:hypothetical protein